MNNNQIRQQLHALDMHDPDTYYVYRTSGSDKCNRCKDYEGKFFRASNKEFPLWPKLPLHPNCRCRLEEKADPQSRQALAIYFHQLDSQRVKNIPKTFKGYENVRYQELDRIIAEVVTDFNARKHEYVGDSIEQTQKYNIPDLSADLVKAWFIQETGGAPNAWRSDPGQVNVPGQDWDYKAKGKDLGLKEPQKRNEGDLKENIIAAVKFLARKGFVPSAQAQRDREKKGYFEGWKIALERYNRSPKIEYDGRPHYKHYAEKIIRRTANPYSHEKIEIR